MKVLENHSFPRYKAWHCWAMMNFKAVNAQTEKIKMLEDSIAMMEKDEEVRSWSFKPNTNNLIFLIANASNKQVPDTF